MENLTSFLLLAMACVALVTCSPYQTELAGQEPSLERDNLSTPKKLLDIIQSYKRSSGCTDGEFQCGDGVCLKGGWLCDTEVDCTDGLDERDCPTNCTGTNQLLCPSGKCVAASSRCDGDDDCGDHSDEAGCDICFCWKRSREEKTRKTYTFKSTRLTAHEVVYAGDLCKLYFGKDADLPEPYNKQDLKRVWDLRLDTTKAVWLGGFVQDGVARWSSGAEMTYYTTWVGSAQSYIGKNGSDHIKRCLLAWGTEFLTGNCEGSWYNVVCAVPSNTCSNSISC